MLALLTLTSSRSSGATATSSGPVGRSGEEGVDDDAERRRRDGLGVRRRGIPFSDCLAARGMMGRPGHEEKGGGGEGQGQGWPGQEIMAAAAETTCRHVMMRLCGVNPHQAGKLNFHLARGSGGFLRKASAISTLYSMYI